MSYNFFIVFYISFEGNERWTIVKTPIEWNEEDIKFKFESNSGCGDEPAVIVSANETSDTNYTWDFT